MIKKILVIITIFCNLLIAQEIKDVKDIKKSSSYLNIISNATPTTIYLDGVKVGETPILQYPVTPGKDIKLKATIDKRFYKDHLERTIRVKEHTIPTFTLKFKKAKAKVFFVGDNGELYINGKFIRVLNSGNRIVEIDTGKDIRFLVKTGYKESSTIKDIYANSFNQVHYNLQDLSLELRLYTFSIDRLMWEDTKDAATKNTTWEQAYEHCEDLTLGGFNDWYIPTLEQLESLYKLYKENEKLIHNGAGEPFYWSNDTFDSRGGIWKYSKVISFNNGKTKKSIQEFENGKIRCVRDITQEEIDASNSVKIIKEK